MIQYYRQLKLAILLTGLSMLTLRGQNGFQPGFVITLENDTLTGQLEQGRSNAQNYQSCIFQSEQGIVEYFPNQLLAFGYKDGKYFSAQIIKGTFVEVLVRGELSLYRFDEKYYLQKGPEFFVIRSDRVVRTIDGTQGIQEDNTWRGVIAYLIGDCISNPTEKVKRLFRREKPLTRLVINYHQCRGSDYTVFKDAIPWTEVYVGLTGGITQSYIQTKKSVADYPFMSNVYSSIDPTIGLTATFKWPRIADRFAIETGLHFSKPAYSAFKENPAPPGGLYDTFFDLTTLTVPLLINYSLAKNDNAFFIQAGSTYDYHLYARSLIWAETITGNVVKTRYERGPFSINKHQFGFGGGMGFNLSFGRFRSSLKIQYIQLPVFNENGGFRVHTDKLSLNLILSRK